MVDFDFNVCKELEPLTLHQLKFLTKEELIEVVLLREISFRNLSKDFEDAVKDRRIKGFALKQYKKALSRSRWWRKRYEKLLVKTIKGLV